MLPVQLQCRSQLLVLLPGSKCRFNLRFDCGETSSKATERNLSWSIAFIKSVFTSLLTKNEVTITFLDVFIHWESSLLISRLFLDSKKNANFTELTCTLNSSSQFHCVHIPYFYHFSFAHQSITESKNRKEQMKKKNTKTRFKWKCFVFFCLAVTEACTSRKPTNFAIWSQLCER